MRSVAAALLVMLLAVGPVGAADAAVPVGLSVSIHNDSSEVRSGERLAYTATVRNQGTDAVDGRLVITVPAFFRVADARGADRNGFDASWTVRVPAGGSVTKKLTGVLGDIPKGQVRVTTLVGVYLGHATQPTIRSADAAAIAGVEDPAHAVSDQGAKPATATGLPLGWIGLGVGVAVLIAAVAAWQLLRLRRAQPRSAERRGTIH
jgi:hypothetical protein